MTEEIKKKIRETAEAALKALKELRETHLQHNLLDVADGPEGIRIFVSDQQGVVDWSNTFPAVYVEISTREASVQLGPFQMSSIYEQLVQQIRPLPQIPIHQHSPGDWGSARDR